MKLPWTLDSGKKIFLVVIVYLFVFVSYLLEYMIPDAAPALLNRKTGLTHYPTAIAKCHRYGRYICVKILDGLGIKCRRPQSFVK